MRTAGVGTRSPTGVLVVPNPTFGAVNPERVAGRGTAYFRLARESRFERYDPSGEPVDALRKDVDGLLSMATHGSGLAGKPRTLPATEDFGYAVGRPLQRLRHFRCSTSSLLTFDLVPLNFPHNR